MRAALAACALCLAVALGPGAGAALAGPGVSLSSGENAETRTVTGAQLRAAADTGPRTYTVRSRANSAGRKITLRGLSIRGLLRLAGFNPDTVDFISIVRQDGEQAILRRAEFAARSPFPEGPALVVDEPGATRYLRPVRGPGSTNSRESFASQVPLDVTVNGGALLAVRASASPRRTSTGRTVSFRAHVRFPPPGASLTYTWNFGDGTQGFGAAVTHRYTREGEFQAQVIANGSGGSTEACEASCGGVATVNVRVGTPRTSPRPDTTQGSTGANPNAPGSGGSGSGSGGSGSGAGSGAGTAGRRARPQAQRAPRVAGGQTVTGILLADSGTASRSSLPTLSPGGGPGAQEAGSGSQGGGKLGGSIALTLVLIVLGALHERRGGRLRLA